MPREDTQFKKGVSGNPKGKPKTVTRRKWMEDILGVERKTRLLEVAIEKALEGHAPSLELILGKCLPPAVTDDAVDINLKDKTHSEKGEEILNALTEKRITPSQAHILFATLCNNVKLVEMTEVISRIAALENIQNGK